MALVIVIDFARRRLLLPCTCYCKRYGTQQQQSPLLGDPKKKKKEAPLSLPHARQALHLSGYVIINCGLLKILWPRNHQLKSGCCCFCWFLEDAHFLQNESYLGHTALSSLAWWPFFNCCYCVLDNVAERRERNPFGNQFFMATFDSGEIRKGVLPSSFVFL